jgi:L-amino acid N-acyltransferase YncA
MLRSCVPGDAPAIVAIYNHYISETVITFEEETVSADEMARRITQVTARYPWLVWEAAGVIAGYAYAARWKSRASYRHSVEAAIYLAPSLTGQGIGTQLYQALLRELQEMGTHCVVGGLALPNAASVALHEKLGYWPQARALGERGLLAVDFSKRRDRNGRQALTAIH